MIFFFFFLTILFIDRKIVILSAKKANFSNQKSKSNRSFFSLANFSKKNKSFKRNDREKMNINQKEKKKRIDFQYSKIGLFILDFNFILGLIY